MPGLGQRARQPAYLGAHRELLNCSRTFFGPQRLCDPDAVHSAFGIKVRGAERQKRRAARDSILRRAREL